MNLITILCCLFVDRYWRFGERVRCYGWANCYLVKLNDRLFAGRSWPDIIKLLVFVLPIVLFTIVLQRLFDGMLWGIVGFVFQLLVLYYCLGETNLKAQYQHYFAAKERGDMAGAYASINTREPQLAENEQEMTHNMAVQFIKLSNLQIVAVLFWFVLLGATGAVLYRLLLLACQYAKQDEHFFKTTGELCVKIRQYFDWIPVRLLAIGYAVAGNFVECFTVLTSYIFSPPRENEQLLIDCGLAAMGVSSSDDSKKSIAEDDEALELVDRVLVVLLVLLALLTLASAL